MSLEEGLHKSLLRVTRVEVLRIVIVSLGLVTLPHIIQLTVADLAVVLHASQ